MNNIIKLTTKQKCDLRSKAHTLKPLVIIGANGLTISVHNEIDYALEDHELIKIRVNANDKKDRIELAKKICDYNLAELIQLVGHVATIYRTKFNLSPKLKNISLLVRKIINIISQNENIEKAYIFESRSKSNTRKVSNIDVVIDCPKITNQEWVGIYDKIKELDTLRVFDIIRLDTADNNFQQEVKKNGTRIYENHK